MIIGSQFWKIWTTFSCLSPYVRIQKLGWEIYDFFPFTLGNFWFCLDPPPWLGKFPKLYLVINYDGFPNQFQSCVFFISNLANLTLIIEGMTSEVFNIYARISFCIYKKKTNSKLKQDFNSILKKILTSSLMPDSKEQTRFSSIKSQKWLQDWRRFTRFGVNYECPL